MAPRYLTKSRYKLARECPTKLYYTGKTTEYANQKLEDSFLQALAEGGYQVGELAKYYFPGGHDIVTLDYDQAVSETNELLKQENVIIYEAAITHGAYFIRADILVKTGSSIDLIEVKAKSFAPGKDKFLNNNGSMAAKWKPYLEDVAFQKYVMLQAFPNNTVKAHLMLVDKTASCPTDGLNQKFMITKDENKRMGISVATSLTDADLDPKIMIQVDVDEICDNTINGADYEDEVVAYATSYSNDTKISSPISSVCGSCEFYTTDLDAEKGLKSGCHECFAEQLGWKDDELSQPTIFDIWNLHYMKKGKLIKDNRIAMSDVTADDIGVKTDDNLGLTASERQWMQVEMAQNGGSGPWVDKAGLLAEVQTWKHPLHFIDFETAMVAIPFHKGMTPYEMIAFQFSHHVIHQDGTIEHKGEYINTQQGEFPNYEFLRCLKDELDNDEGTIFRYAAHENSVLNAIYRQLQNDPVDIPDLEDLCDFIKSITTSVGGSPENWTGERSMVDMLELVKLFYYEPSTNGSNSIKYVLPSILNVSKALQEKYSQPIYGAEGGIVSMNFEDWTWVQIIGGKVSDPYVSLPKMFENMTDRDSTILNNDEIREGGAAMTAYARMQFEEMSDEERNEIRKALMKYCELDTLAMVMIYEGWMDMLEN